jgi:hypothetical protein
MRSTVRKLTSPAVTPARHPGAGAEELPFLSLSKQQQAKIPESSPEAREDQPLLQAHTRPRTVGTIQLAIWVFLCANGGAYGAEEIVASTSPVILIVAILLVPWVWCLPVALVTAELSTAFSNSSGGMIEWAGKAFGLRFSIVSSLFYWASNTTDNSMYSILIPQVGSSSSFQSMRLPLLIVCCFLIDHSTWATSLTTSCPSGSRSYLVSASSPSSWRSTPRGWVRAGCRARCFFDSDLTERDLVWCRVLWRRRDCAQLPDADADLLAGAVLASQGSSLLVLVASAVVLNAFGSVRSSGGPQRVDKHRGSHLPSSSAAIHRPCWQVKSGHTDWSVVFALVLWLFSGFDDVGSMADAIKK